VGAPGRQAGRVAAFRAGSVTEPVCRGYGLPVVKWPGWPFTGGKGGLVAGRRIEVGAEGVMMGAGTIRAAGTKATAGKMARPAGYVRDDFARARGVRCA
jgi:hypothetical protein